MKKLPKTIYVQLQEDGSNTYMDAQFNVEGVPDDGKVGVYELKEIKSRRTQIHLE